MLNAMRENLKHLKILLWLVAFAMVGYLGSFFIGDQATPQANAAWAVRIGSSEISRSVFVTKARQVENNYRRLFGDGFDELKPQLLIGSQAVRDLINREIMLQEAHRLGLTVSDEDVALRIRADPSFKDVNGEFVGLDRYDRYVSQSFRGGVEAYEAALRGDLMVEKWQDLVSQSALVTDAELEQVFRRRTEKTAIDYVVVPASTQAISTDVSDSETRGWYDEHQDDYRRGEGRRVRYIVVDRAAQQQLIEITDDELNEAYNANRANYTHPEQRRAQHILFRVDQSAPPEEREDRRAQAQAVWQRVEDGEEFSTLASELSEDPASASRGGDLDFFARGEMVPQFEEAAFSTAAGQLAPLVETDFGFHVIRVTDERTAGVTPFVDVADELRRSLLIRAADERVRSEADRLLGEIQGAGGFEELVSREGLEATSRLIIAGDRLGDLGAGPEFVSSLFELEVGSVSVPLLVAQGLALVAVDEVLPAGVAPLDEVRSEVKGDLLNARARQGAVREGSRALADHGELSEVAQALGLEVEGSGDLAPDADVPGTGGLTAEARQRLFGESALMSDRGIVEVPAGALVYEITLREPFDPVRFGSERAALREEVVTQRRVQLTETILERLNDDVVIEVNEALIERFNG